MIQCEHGAGFHACAAVCAGHTVAQVDRQALFFLIQLLVRLVVMLSPVDALIISDACQVYKRKHKIYFILCMLAVRCY